ncbi:MAG: hypothetical protein WKF84_05040 [Pyrinomonadaceae bacterium]
MAVATIYTIIRVVVFMAKLHRLLTVYVLAGVVTRAVDFRDHPEGTEQDKNRTEDAQLGKSISTMVKDLGHHCTLNEFD